jgi:hypothetical protein
MGKWTEYYINYDFTGFWLNRMSDPAVRTLMVLGVGFDPRCLRALKNISEYGSPERLGYIALELNARTTFDKAGTLMKTRAESNQKELGSYNKCHKEAVFTIATHDEEGHNIAGRNVLRQIGSATEIFKKYTDVVVDISGMPRGIFFPLIAYLLRLADKNIFQNLHVSVVEDPLLDSRISGSEYGQADFIHTFHSQQPNKYVWLPLIGMNERARLSKIHDKIKDLCIEICPILPFPSSSLRRVDDIVLSHNELLFEGFLVSPDNLLLCDERNPFDVYRKILDVEEYYRHQLSAIPEIGKITTVVSPLSSKTLSLGMLLAAVERQLPVCHVEPGAYQFDSGSNGATPSGAECNPTEIWLSGEPYTR